MMPEGRMQLSRGHREVRIREATDCHYQDRTIFESPKHC